MYKIVNTNYIRVSYLKERAFNCITLENKYPSKIKGETELIGKKNRLLLIVL